MTKRQSSLERLGNLKVTIDDATDEILGLIDAHGNERRLVTAVTGPGGGVTLNAGDRRLYPVESPPSAENRLVVLDALTYLFLSENSRRRAGVEVASQMILESLTGAAPAASPAVTALYREDGVTQFTSAGYTHAWFWDDYQLIQVKDFVSGIYYLYKSVTDGISMGNNAPLYDNAQPVFVLGWNTNRTAIAEESYIMADWSLARGVNRRGEDLIVFGQYANGTTRVPGGARDWSNIICSRDGGDTYETVLELNTAGVRIVKHLHAVSYDPYAKEFWCQYGDAAESALYVWDGVGSIEPNTLASQAHMYKGWRGMDRYNNPTGSLYNLQTTVLLFTPDEVIAPVDHGFSAGFQGVYRFSRDLTVLERIAGPEEMQLPIGHAMYSATMCKRTGTIVASTLIEASFTNPDADYTLWLWTATPAGNYRDWKRVGRYMVNTASGARAHSVMWSRNDGQILIGMANCAGMGATTSILQIEGVHSGDEDVIHPVYYVDPLNGSNANSGRSRAQAWASVGYACSANRMTSAALCRVLPGIGNEGASAYTVTIAANARPAQTNYPLVIEGAGRDRTRIVSACPTPWLTNGATKRSFVLRSMTVQNTVGAIYDFGAGAAQSVIARFSDVRLVCATSPFFLTSGTIHVEQFYASVGTYLAAGAGDGNYGFVAESGVVRGGSRVGYLRGGPDAATRFENLTCIGQTAAAVQVLPLAVNLPVVRNVALTTNLPVVLDERTTKTSAAGVVGHNISRAASVGLVGGNEGSQVVADLMLVASTGAPRPGSPLIGSGNASAGPVRDINGDVFTVPKNVGAFA